MKRLLTTLTTAVAGIVASLGIAGLVPAASAHVGAPPAVTAQHVFVGDPLYGLDTPAGSLYAIKPDEQTAMASTTKIWTLDLTSNFLATGVVHLDDKVTINAFEAGVGGSLMVDVFKKPLEAGEVVKFRDLVRGMMYQSGNNAAYAIADHIAQAYWGANADWHDFVALMNLHALALGQTHTHFQNPNGFDNPSHYTSARDLAAEFEHGLHDAYFAQVVGFSGVYTATTQGPSGTKNYSFSWGRPYTGWDGEKGGSTPNCMGPNVDPGDGCFGIAATRIGRRVVAGLMQADAPEVSTLLDYGFATIFHPDPHGTSAAAGAVQRQAIDCFGSASAVHAVLPPSGPVTLALWHADVDGSSVAKVTEASLPGSGGPLMRGGAGQSGDVAVTRLSTGDIILATRKTNEVELSRWRMDRGGTLELLASGIQAGAATTMGLQPVYGDMFLSAMTSPSGALVVKSWRLQGTGLVNLDTYTDSSRTFTETSIAGPVTTDVFSGHRAVTASLNTGQWSLVHNVWGVDQLTGKIGWISETSYPFATSHVSISPFFVKPAFDGELPSAYYATAYESGAGFQIRFYRIDETGKAVDAGTTYSNGAIPGTQARLAPLGTGGLMSAISDAGNVRLVAWDLHREADDTITPTAVAEHALSPTASLSLCRLQSAHAEGDYVTATRDGDGQLRLRAYRSGDRPY